MMKRLIALCAVVALAFTVSNASLAQGKMAAKPKKPMTKMAKKPMTKMAKKPMAKMAKKTKM